MARSARAAACSLAFIAAGVSAAGRIDSLADLCGNCHPVLYAHCGGFLEGPNFDSNGHLWSVDYKGGNIVEVAGGACRIVANTGGMPNGSRFHPDGRLFIADARRGLLIFDPHDRSITVRAATVAGKPIVGGNDLVFDKGGGLYMTVVAGASALRPTGMVVYLAPGERDEPQILADGLAFPNGLALSPDGTRLYVGLYADKTILVLPPADRAPPYLTSWVFARTDSGVGPDGMMADVRGRLWWANFGDGTISVAGSTGRVIGRIALSEGAGPGTTNMTVHDGALYITEASRGDIWRVPLTGAVTTPAGRRAPSGHLPPSISANASRAMRVESSPAGTPQ